MMRTYRVFQGLVLALSLLLFGGAGCHRQPARQEGSAAAKPGAPRPAMPAGMKVVTNHACELLTKDDAEQLLGGPVKAPITSMTADIGVVSSRCGYISEANHPVKVVTLLARRWQQAADARQAYERAHALAQSVSGQVPENVAGLGNRSYWAGGTVSQLNVLSGDTWLVISGTAGPGADQLRPAKAAASKILAHSP